jgi:hypothetical protein
MLARSASYLLALSLIAQSASDFAQAAETEIFLIDRPASEIAHSISARSEGTVDQALADLKEETKTYITFHEEEHAVIFVVREPVKVGSRIRTEHQFTRPSTGALKPYRFDYTVSENDLSNPLIIVNRSHAGGRGGSIEYRIYLEGELVGSLEVSIGQ